MRNLADGKGSLTHDYVKIRFECRQCGRDNVYTYDLGSEGKRCRSGKYTAVSHEKRGISGLLYLDFDTCQNIFDRMWQGWSPTSTCGTWASDFYEKAMSQHRLGGKMGQILDCECSEFPRMTRMDVSRAMEEMEREFPRMTRMDALRAAERMDRLEGGWWDSDHWWLVQFAEQKFLSSATWAKHGQAKHLFSSKVLIRCHRFSIILFKFFGRKKFCKLESCKRSIQFTGWRCLTRSPWRLTRSKSAGVSQCACPYISYAMFWFQPFSIFFRLCFNMYTDWTMPPLLANMFMRLLHGNWIPEACGKQCIWNTPESGALQIRFAQRPRTAQRPMHRGQCTEANAQRPMHWMREESERRMLGTANSLFLTRLERERPQTSALPVCFCESWRQFCLSRPSAKKRVRRRYDDQVRAVRASG